MPYETPFGICKSCDLALKPWFLKRAAEGTDISLELELLPRLCLKCGDLLKTLFAEHAVKEKP
jgi:hypothetical protein